MHDTQRFFYESITGELWSAVPSGIRQADRDEDARLCVTAGWPFLTGSAFQTPAGRTAVVLMNEAETDTHVILSDVQRSVVGGSGTGDLWFGITGRSIQTIMY